MNETSRRLFTATRDALYTHRVRTRGALDVDAVARVAVVATLRELVFMMNRAEVAEVVEGGDWPSAHDLHLLANDVEASL